MSTVGIRQGQTATFNLRKANAGGVADVQFGFGRADGAGGTPVYIPVTGNWSNDATTWTVVSDSVGVGLQTFEDGSAVPGVAYQYRVKAVNACGSSAWSNTASATPPLEACAFAPAAPEAVAATALGPTQVSVSWIDAAMGSNNEQGYEVKRWTWNATTSAWESETVLSSSVAANATSYMDSTTVLETTYRYEVRALSSACGNSTWKSSGSVTTPAASPDYALELDGTSHHVDAGNSDTQRPLQPTTGLTVEAWIKPTRLDHSSVQAIVSRRKAGGVSTSIGGYELHITPSNDTEGANKVRFAIYDYTGAMRYFVTFLQLCRTNGC